MKSRNEIQIVCEKGTITFNKTNQRLGFLKNNEGKFLGVKISDQLDLLNLLQENKMDDSIEFLESKGYNVIFID